MGTPTYVARKVGDQYVFDRTDPTARFTCGLMAAGGGALALYGIVRRGLLGTAAILAGACMLYRGLSGQNPLAGRLQAWRARSGSGRGSRHETPSYPADHDERLMAGQVPDDDVDEASMESFPASDPPARHRSDPTGT